MSCALLIAEAVAQPWAITVEALSAIAAVLSDWKMGRNANPADFAEIHARAGARSAPGNGAIAGGVQVLSMHGVLSQRGDLLEAIFGGGSVPTDAVGRALDAAIADDAVAGIVLDIDSPGGSVFGVGELADKVYQARAIKPVYAIANSMAASAAYWIGANATQMFVTPGGEVGSIGVLALHTDLSMALENEGVKMTLITAGKHKGELSPFAPLSPDAKAAAQDRVDSYYGSFTRAVARGRGVNVDRVRSGMAQGRIAGASKALAENMVDDVATLDQVIAKLGRALRDGRTPAERVALAGARSSAAAFSGSDDQARLRQAQRARDLELSLSRS